MWCKELAKNRWCAPLNTAQAIVGKKERSHLSQKTLRTPNVPYTHTSLGKQYKNWSYFLNDLARFTVGFTKNTACSPETNSTETRNARQQIILHCFPTLQSTAQFHAMTISINLLPHHLLHKNNHCNTSSAAIALPATSPVTIHLLGLVRFSSFRNTAPLPSWRFFTWCPWW